MDDERREDETSEEASAGLAASPTGDHRLKGIVESILFASGEPVPLRRLVEVLGGPSAAEVRAVLAQIAERCVQEDRGVRLLEVAGGYQLRTARENADWVRAVFRDRPRRLGRAALETLAIIAYRGPVTKAEVEAVRGVDIEGVLGTLIRRDMIKVCGRKEAVGRPLLYGTTDRFLELFGLRDLADLPTLKDLPQAAEVPANGEARVETAGDAAAEAAEPSGGDLASSSGGIDTSRQGQGGWPAGEGAGGEGGSEAATS